MTRGRVFSVNAEQLPEWRDVEGEGVPRQREANFTWADALPDGNVLIEGDWWDADTDRAWISLEGLCTRCGCRRGRSPVSQNRRRGI